MDQPLKETSHPAQREGHAPPQRRTPPRRDVPGWGVDLAPEDRPAYPMERMPPRLPHMPDGDPPPQPVTIEVFHSSERPGITPIFGTSTPPSGLSGRVRKFAFGYSENDMRHWLLLLFADRINMVEGLFSDLSRGHVPNVFAEMGGRAALKHNPAGVARKAAIGAAIGITAYVLLRRRRRVR
jgi:hypothetical protein